MSYRKIGIDAPYRSAVVTGALVSLVLLAGQGVGAEGGGPSENEAWPALDQPVSSFGGAVLDGRLYVYSGHIGEAHAHSKKNLSTTFQRLPLDGMGSWEQLPEGPGLQGLPLASWNGAVYRVGGLSAKNEPGDDADLTSVVDFVRYDPAAKSWTPLPPLPEGRSSHDAAAANGKLYVVGGWNLGGGEEKWHASALVFDLSQSVGAWKELPRQPFERRALASVVHGGKLYACGGMTPEGPSLDVDCLDLATGRWRKGPAIPDGGMKGKMNGFGCSACTIGDRLFLSTMDGVIRELTSDGAAWRDVGRLRVARFFHRLLPRNERELIVVAGASMKLGHLGSIESFAVPGRQP